MPRLTSFATEHGYIAPACAEHELASATMPNKATASKCVSMPDLHDATVPCRHSEQFLPCSVGAEVNALERGVLLVLGTLVFPDGFLGTS